ncbi:roadblock/LC7 domain-containing protein [Thermocoleostomius sinensis]|jgi:predicted regulator of Ras-like GTPase activity (Roadblock/LC7/MglB family)|uniref:Roadblock/LC7 domain-containing protein n=1 Tax=Thermocoleostomius sinensis A174 TaxID=2016057 RepID=A0A9E9C7L0_9CYAN|nr:roadblock/LC7 domain-containing protein [Thermocoleostomius sinensis]WAL60469.1 roadblock/LC7 domain-containing protein [Thermocoleostomius sinensis A174]
MAISTEKLGYILQNFVTTTAEVQGAALVTPDGLPLATNLPGSMDEERVSAMSAAMLSLGERIGVELVRGAIDRIYVEGEEGFSILTSCGQDAVFLVLANRSAKQGVLLLEIKRAVSELRQVLNIP